MIEALVRMAHNESILHARGLRRPTPPWDQTSVALTGVLTPVGSLESIGVKRKMIVTYNLILTSCSCSVQILPCKFFRAQILAETQLERIVEICAASFVLYNHNGLDGLGPFQNLVKS